MAKDEILGSVIDSIGETPLVALDRICANLDGRILAKLEFANPGFSKKDRIAREIIEEAERSDACRSGFRREKWVFLRFRAESAGMRQEDK